MFVTVGTHWSDRMLPKSHTRATKMNACEQNESIAKVCHKKKSKLLFLSFPSPTDTDTYKRGHPHTEIHTSPIPPQSSGLAERQLRQSCGAFCCSLCIHLSPPAILASVIPLVHLNTDADLRSLFFLPNLLHGDG